ncbi:MAG: GNAT family N-acetyltransferase [Polyangiaceae bacterium]|nr:GNAT family N-acetyltransferase [Polyangiaceae bacterium]MCB9606883.1 GNAT family N-acetyltransferase [Polyangiaceae bacterium]
MRLSEGMILRTERLVMRPFVEADAEAFAKINADPQVMEHYPAPLSRGESDALLDRINTSFRENGFGVWALELGSSSALLGYTGLAIPTWENHLTPCVEVGWRLGREHWGNGYASEAARAALEVAFTDLGLSEVLSFTSLPNHRSARVMQRIGMRRDEASDFAHPNLPADHPLSRHIVYRISAAEWEAVRAAAVTP